MSSTSSMTPRHITFPRSVQDIFTFPFNPSMYDWSHETTTTATRHASSPLQSLINIRPFSQTPPYVAVPRVIFVSHQAGETTTHHQPSPAQQELKGQKNRKLARIQNPNQQLLARISTPSTPGLKVKITTTTIIHLSRICFAQSQPQPSQNKPRNGRRKGITHHIPDHTPPHCDH